jgi:hypothetical protein
MLYMNFLVRQGHIWTNVTFEIFFTMKISSLNKLFSTFFKVINNSLTLTNVVYEHFYYVNNLDKHFSYWTNTIFEHFFITSNFPIRTYFLYEHLYYFDQFSYMNIFLVMNIIRILTSFIYEQFYLCEEVSYVNILFIFEHFMNNKLIWKI